MREKLDAFGTLLSTIETIATTLIFLGLCCVNRSTFLPHFSTTPIHFHNSSTINRLFLQSYLTSSRINSGCGSCGHCFLPKLYTLFPATISSPVLNQAKQAPIEPANKSVKEALYLLQQLKRTSRTETESEQTPCPVTPAAAIYRIVTSSLTISWLSCPVPELLTRLAIYVVPFSNAKVVGSFRMARLNMFRR